MLFQDAILKRVEDAETLLGKAPVKAQEAHEFTVAKSYIVKIRQAMPPSKIETATEIVYWLTRLFSLITILIERHKKQPT